MGTTRPDEEDAPDQGELSREALVGILEQHPLSLAIAYDSRVHGDPFPWSDLDVAVRFDRSVDERHRARTLDRLAAELEDATEASSVDVVDLDAIGPHHAYEAVTDGMLLLGDAEELVDLEARLLIEKLDFEPVLEAWRDGLADRIEGGRYGRA